MYKINGKINMFVQKFFFHRRVRLEFVCCLYLKSIPDVLGKKAIGTNIDSLAFAFVTKLSLSRNI